MGISSREYADEQWKLKPVRCRGKAIRKSGFEACVRSQCLIKWRAGHQSNEMKAFYGKRRLRGECHRP